MEMDLAAMNELCKGTLPELLGLRFTEASRDRVVAELFVLADRAGILRDPELAAERMRRVLALAGV